MENVRSNKKTRPIWPWIVGVLAILSLVLWYISENGKNAGTQMNRSAVPVNNRPLAANMPHTPTAHLLTVPLG